jgi:hypothetical protein
VGGVGSSEFREHEPSNSRLLHKKINRVEGQDIVFILGLGLESKIMTVCIGKEKVMNNSLTRCAG